MNYNCFLGAQAKLRDVASLEGHVLLKKLRDALESLRGRMAGRGKEDVEQAISMVSCFALPYSFSRSPLFETYCVTPVTNDCVLFKT